MADRRRRSVLRRAATAAAAVLAAGAAAYGSTYTPLFAADAVRVEGAARLSDAAVRRLGGVDVGTNVAHLDVAAVQRRLMGDPRVASATVAPDPPDLVTIRIAEQTPVATALIDGRPALVAEDGAILPGEPSSGLPEIRAVAGVLNAQRRVAAARALAALPSGVRHLVDTVFSTAAGELVLQTAGEVTVTYGPATDVDAKGAALRAIFGWASERSIELASIDVTVPTAPTARTVDGDLRRR